MSFHMLDDCPCNFLITFLAAMDRVLFEWVESLNGKNRLVYSFSSIGLTTDWVFRGTNQLSQKARIAEPCRGRCLWSWTHRWNRDSVNWRRDVHKQRRSQVLPFGSSTYCHGTARCKYFRTCLIHLRSPTLWSHVAQTKVAKNGSCSADLGLSLFSLLSHTCTPHGHALLRQWFLSPLLSVEKIAERHDTVAFFMESGRQDAVQSIRMLLKRAGNVQAGLKGVRRGGIGLIFRTNLGAKRIVGKKGSNVVEWRALLQVFRSSALLIAVLKQCHWNLRDRTRVGFSGTPDYAKGTWILLLMKVITLVEPQTLHEVGSTIKEIIDFEGSSLEARFLVRRGVDQEVQAHLGRFSCSWIICVMSTMVSKTFLRTLQLDSQRA